ncbi:MAG: RluA family pseudouridine synthase [Candidatus Melainabacteria bacterium]|nr:RluA family pseudouridine synthase [Candidatus Melainabacteria bacterium]
MSLDDPVILTVTQETAAKSRLRLDRYLAMHVEGLSRSRLQKLIGDGQVTVNGIIARSSHALAVGDEIALHVPPPETLEAIPQDIPLRIIFEDSDLLVIDKPAGMVTHPGAGVKDGTLVNAVLFHCKGSLSSVGGIIRPGIVHRLDKDTSGLIMVAKNDLAHVGLSQQLKDKTARRTYQAIVEGHPPARSGTVDQPIGRHPGRRMEMAVIKDKNTADARDAVTHYEVIGDYRRFAHLECRLETGRTHQIRVHMAYLGAPVAFDLVYNHKTTGNTDARRKAGMIGQALHAVKLSFTHPRTGELLSFSSPLPDDMVRFIGTLI